MLSIEGIVEDFSLTIHASLSGEGRELAGVLIARLAMAQAPVISFGQRHHGPFG
jgi:hypothetical protein